MYRGYLLLGDRGKVFGASAFFYVPDGELVVQPGKAARRRRGGTRTRALGRSSSRSPRGAKPHPRRSSTEVAVNGKPVVDPQSYLRLYTIGSKATTYPTDTLGQQTVLQSDSPTPWTDGNDVVVYPKSHLLVRDGQIVSIPGDDRRPRGARREPRRRRRRSRGCWSPAALAALAARARPSLRRCGRGPPRSRSPRPSDQVEEGLDAYRAFRREQGDFEALFRAHYPEIVRYLSARLGSRDDALELASEVFAEAWRRVPGLQWRGRPGPRVALPRRSEHGRRRAEAAGAPLTRSPPTCRRPTTPRRPATGIALATRAAVRCPPDHQLVVHLRLVEGLPFAEVARVMNRSVGACQMLMLRAGRALRDALAAKGCAMSDERALAQELDRALAGEDVGATRLASSPRCSSRGGRAGPLRASRTPRSSARSRAHAPRAVESPAPHAVPLARARRGRSPSSVRRSCSPARRAATSRRAPHAPSTPRPSSSKRAAGARPVLFPATEVTGYVDGRSGRAHLRISPPPGVVAETSSSGWTAASSAGSARDEHDHPRAVAARLARRLRRDARPVRPLRRALDRRRAQSDASARG